MALLVVAWEDGRRRNVSPTMSTPFDRCPQQADFLSSSYTNTIYLVYEDFKKTWIAAGLIDLLAGLDIIGGCLWAQAPYRLRIS